MSSRLGQMYITTEEFGEIAYTFRCDPPEKAYYSTIKFRPSDIRIIDKLNPTDRAKVRKMILEEINAELLSLKK
jgi:hypothetical protein